MGSFSTDDFVNGRYRVVRPLGKGAMGTVYLAEDLLKVQRRVALKVLNAENVDDSEEWSKGEYEALTRLRHPNLARVFDFGRVRESDDFYIVSEFIRGEDLLTASQDFSLEELNDVIVQICRALEYIHTQGYIHFDIKPDNILVTRQRSIGEDGTSKVQWQEKVGGSTDKGSGPPRVKLIDFGLAERITGTFAFAIKGTLHYVAPEIIAGGTPDRRADLYSFGVSLCQILTGKLPFVSEEGTSLPQARTNWREKLRRSLAGQPEYLIDIVLRLLDHEPDRRFSSSREIIQTLNAGAGRHYQIETPETQVSYLHCSRLIGRRKELNQLKEAAETLLLEKEETSPADICSPGGDEAEMEAFGSPILHLVTGEIGCGKSRLLEEFDHFLKMREVPFHIGNCYETSHDPYQAFREIFEQVAIDVGLDSEIFMENAATIRKLCPRLRESGEEQGADEEMRSREDKERLYFIEKLSAFLLDATRISPRVICLNNLHWADEATISLLEKFIETVARRKRKGQVVPLVVVTLRSDEILPEALRGLISRVKEQGGIEEISLRRFNRAQITELIHHMLQVEEIPAQILDRLEERTGGNPLFIVETLKSLQEEGIIAREGEVWCIRNGGDLSRVEMPHGIGAILLRRVRSLDSAERAALQFLAVHDKPTSLRLIEHLTASEGTDPRSPLRELENRGMVSKSFDGGKTTFSINQPKLREMVYEDLSDSLRKRLHGELGEALAGEHEGDIEGILEDLAYHFQLSDRQEKALELTLQAAESMSAIFAHKRAIEHYSHVLAQVNGKPEHFDVWWRAQERIGDIATIRGDLDTAHGSYDELLQCEAPGVGTSGEWDRARVLRKMGKLDEIQGDYKKALRHYRESVDQTENVDNVEGERERVKALSSLAWINVCLGQYDRAMKISADALQLADQLDEQAEHAMIFTTIASANLYKGNIHQAVEFHQRALEIRERLEQTPEIIISLNRLGEAYLAGAEYSEALQQIDQALAASEEIGDAFGRAMSLNLLATTHLQLGDLDTADRFLGVSLKLSREFRMRFLTLRNHLLRGRLRKERGDHSGGESDLLRVLGAYARQGVGQGLVECLLELADLQCLATEYDKAIDSIGRAVSSARTLGNPILEVRALLLEITIDRTSKRESFEKLLQRVAKLVPMAESTGLRELRAAVDIERAELSVQSRDLEEARRWYQAAEDHIREVADRLSHGMRETYLSRHRISLPRGGASEVREIDLPPAPEVVPTAETVTREETSDLTGRQKELLRVASLLQDVGQNGNFSAFLPKVVNCLTSACRAEAGFLLTRDGDAVRVVSGFDGHGEPLRSCAHLICLEALEDVWENSRAVLAPRVVDDPRVQGYESLYSHNIGSLAILPVKSEGAIRAVVYLVNPGPEELVDREGGPVLLAYLNLLSLILPRRTSSTIVN